MNFSVIRRKSKFNKTATFYSWKSSFCSFSFIQCPENNANFEDFQKAQAHPPASLILLLNFPIRFVSDYYTSYDIIINQSEVTPRSAHKSRMTKLQYFLNKKIFIRYIKDPY